MVYVLFMVYVLDQFKVCFNLFTEFMQVSFKNNFSFDLRSGIFWTKSHLSNEFSADSNRFRMFVLLWPILINRLECPRREIRISNFSRYFCQLTCLPFRCLRTINTYVCVCVCVCVCVYVCLYSFTVKASFVCSDVWDIPECTDQRSYVVSIILGASAKDETPASQQIG